MGHLTYGLFYDAVGSQIHLLIEHIQKPKSSGDWLTSLFLSLLGATICQHVERSFGSDKRNTSEQSRHSHRTAPAATCPPEISRDSSWVARGRCHRPNSRDAHPDRLHPGTPVCLGLQSLGALEPKQLTREGSPVSVRDKSFSRNADPGSAAPPPP